MGGVEKMRERERKKNNKPFIFVLYLIYFPFNFTFFHALPLDLILISESFSIMEIVFKIEWDFIMKLNGIIIDLKWINKDKIEKKKEQKVFHKSLITLLSGKMAKRDSINFPKLSF